jgi:PAS domain S-box-containing protein
MMGAVDKCDEARFIRQNGAVQWIAWEVRPWYIRDGEIGGILMYTADITERKQVQQQLRINEAQLRGAFENSTTGMALVGLRGDWLKVNNSLCKFIGYSAEELLQIRFQDITHPEDLDGDLDLLEELLAGKRDYYRMEKRYIHKQGHTVWALLSVSLIRSAEGQPLHFVSQINDITDEKKLAQLRLAIHDQAYSFIAHELHENFAQTLAATRMFIELSMDGNRDKQTFLQKSLENIETLTQQIQALTQTIAPTTLINEDYFSLIGDLVENYTGQAGMKIRYDFDPDVSSADPATGFHLFRILENQLKVGSQTAGAESIDHHQQRTTAAHKCKR